MLGSEKSKNLDLVRPCIKNIDSSEGAESLCSEWLRKVNLFLT